MSSIRTSAPRSIVLSPFFPNSPTLKSQSCRLYPDTPSPSARPPQTGYFSDAVTSPLKTCVSACQPPSSRPPPSPQSTALPIKSTPAISTTSLSTSFAHSIPANSAPLTVFNVDLSAYHPIPFLHSNSGESPDPLQRFLTENGSVVERLVTLRDYIGANQELGDYRAEDAATVHSTLETGEEDIDLSDNEIWTPMGGLSQGSMANRASILNKGGKSVFRRVTRRSRSKSRYGETTGLGGLMEI
jgi:hypothetical protein